MDGKIGVVNGMLVKAKFNFENEKMRSDEIISDFMEMRHAAVEMLKSSLYDMWNEEYDSQFGEPKGEYDIHYMQYIVDKQRPFLEAVNSKFEDRSIKLSSDPEEYGDIIGIVKKDGSKIDMVLIPV